MQWFVNLMEELGIECLVGHPATIRAAEPRKQKHDRRDAELILKLLVEGRFPAIWLPSKELQDLRSLLRHRHQWVRMRTRIQNALQSIALANGLRRGPALWSQDVTGPSFCTTVNEKVYITTSSGKGAKGGSQGAVGDRRATLCGAKVAGAGGL
jgi:hypothetical protein